MTDPNIIISVRHVSKHFPGVHALQDLSFDIRQGEILGLVGENGAGKSTLVKILAGVHRKDEGEILIDGTRASISSPLDAQHKGMSFIFQERNLAPFLTVQENIFAGRQPRSRLGFINWRKLSAQTRELLDVLKVDLEPETMVSSLSVAEQQITEIARALSFSSKVIVIDEPTASISDEDAETLFAIIRKLKSKGVTTVFISHRLEEVLSLTDRIVVLRDGRLVGIRDTADTSQNEVIRLMVGRELPAEEKGMRARVESRVILGVRNLSCPGSFRDISFDLHAGEILGIAGLVGAKRTEVLRALFGFLPGSRGDISIDGQKSIYSKPSEAISLGISYLSEDRKGEGIFPFMSVTKNITVASLQDFTRAGFLDQKREKQKSKELVGALDIKAPNIGSLLLTLSGGNQQKAILARGLLTRPRIFLLDEPTVGIDVGAKFEIYKILAQLASEGVGIIFVSSELPELLRFCHRIIVMCQGRITGEFTAEEANQEAIMVRATQFVR
jgi:ribose transport system ATP-binding protein